MWVIEALSVLFASEALGTQLASFAILLAFSWRSSVFMVVSEFLGSSRIVEMVKPGLNQVSCVTTLFEI